MQPSKGRIFLFRGGKRGRGRFNRNNNVDHNENVTSINGQRQPASKLTKLDSQDSDLINSSQKLTDRTNQPDAMKTEGLTNTFQDLKNDSSTSQIKKKDLVSATINQNFCQRLSAISLHSENEEIAPDHFSRSPIEPTISELRSHNTKVALRKNLSVGSYDSVEDYLDVQFRLMREDFISPLREAIIDYNGFERKKVANIHLYRYTKIVCSFGSHVGIVHHVHFSVGHLGFIDWESSKRFMFGSLVVLTPDNFKTIYFAVVADRNPGDLRRGLITLRFLADAPPEHLIYLMAESIAFYEAYYHVLAQLQNLNIAASKFPMVRYIVFCENVVKPPRYLLQSSAMTYDLKVIADNGSKKFQKSLTVLPLSTKTNWPDKAKLGFDNNQMDALKTALTKELVLIQGPPGTGKTYIGLKIVKILVECPQSKLKDFGPILVVCLTNHALDQFMEGIDRFMPGKGIVRVGGRSQSEIMEKYSLKNLRQKLRKQNNLPKELITAKKNMFKEIRLKETEYLKHLKTVDSTFEKVTKLSTLSSIISIPHQKKLSDKIIGRSDNAILTWLFNTNISVFDDVSEYAREDYIETLIQEEIFHEISELLDNFKTADSSNSTMKVEDNFTWETNRRILDIDRDPELRQLKLKKELIGTLFEDNFFSKLSIDGWQIKVSKQNLDKILQKKLRNSEKVMTELEVNQVEDPWNLSIEDRWRLYSFWLVEYRKQLNVKSKKLESEYNRLCSKNAEIQMQVDFVIMKRSKIVGMTTTGAARYRNVLDKLSCKIVIIEEAAEVLESHIVASLNQGLQHLILIGDHKQLKPSTAVYKLAKDYDLDLSLFERLINNKVHCVSLALQHRMRPEISRIMRFIYEDLKDHHSVEQYENIRGMSSNVFFLDHTEPERHSSVTMSYCNPFEALFAVKLCQYFLLNGYEAQRITILTLYSDQLFSLKNLMPQKIFEGVRVCVVDNYQGEENDIIILSLVRSNERGNIGFLKIENRVCVALSRAKMGFYAFGNFALLEQNSELWKNIVLHLRNDNKLGSTLSLNCQIHPMETSVCVSQPEDFKLVPGGGCSKLCQQLLQCDHLCTKYCHPMGQEHLEYECREPCKRLCDHGHLCQKYCYEDCECLMLVEKVLPSCNHVQSVPCSVLPEYVRCREKCNRTLVCGHLCPGECSMDCLSMSCHMPCTSVCPNGHSCMRKCSENCGLCSVIVEKIIPFCGHKQNVPCCILPENFQCKEIYTQVLSCGHRYETTCGNQLSVKLCQMPCSKKCDSGHLCRKLCSEKCECLVMTEKVVPDCKHIQQIACSIPASTFVCQDKCSRLLSCGHSCSKNCGEVCNREGCTFEVNVKNWFCGHQHAVLCKDRMKNDLLCTKPCNDVLPCGHHCKGTCGECSNSRLHISCRAKCDRKLVCGHKCGQRCCDPCPPCQQICEDNCNHERCPFGCSNLCEPCSQKCSRKQTSYGFSVVRKQSDCGTPCNKLIPCRRCSKKNVCIGLAAEICPQLCRNCDKMILDSIVSKYNSGISNNKTVHFITLQTCKHTFEVRFLDQWMSTVNTKEKIFKRKVCPECSASIVLHSCKRYSESFSDFKNVLDNTKMILFSKTMEYFDNENKFHHQITSSLNQFILKRSKEFKGKQFTFKSKGNIHDRCEGSPLLLANELVCSKNSLSVITEVDNLFKLFEKNFPSKFAKYILRSLSLLIEWLSSPTRSFIEFEIIQVYNEMARIGNLFWVNHAIQVGSRQFARWEVEASKLIYCGAYSKDMQDLFQNRLGQIYSGSSLLSSFKLKKRCSLQFPFDFQEGHWLICSKCNDKVHFFTEDQCKECEGTKTI